MNGYALGRFWQIGPQQTLFCPGCWLKRGKNEIVEVDVVGTAKPELWGQDQPELDQLNLPQPPSNNIAERRPNLSDVSAALDVSLPEGNGWQLHALSAPRSGRYLALVVDDTYVADAPAALAELYVRNAEGTRLLRDGWAVHYADSEHLDANHTADKAFDLQESTYWQAMPSHAKPHLLVIDMGSEQSVSAIELLPRAEQGAPGSISRIKVYVY